mgnify:CR=1 FL=1
MAIGVIPIQGIGSVRVFQCFSGEKLTLGRKSAQIVHFYISPAFIEQFRSGDSYER